MNKEDIKNLACYKKMTPIQQKFVVKYKNLQKINHHLQLIKNMGYKRWFVLSNPYYLNKIVIDEIYSQS